MAFVSAVEGDHRGFEWGMPQGALDETGVDTGFEQLGGVGMSQGMDGDAHCGDSGTVFGGAAGALDPGATHGRERRRTVLGIPPRGGKEPGGVTRGFPVGAQQRQRLCG
jgi:hypothetical protein